jgi:uncharacterized RDD family membrane protein YckC
MSRHHRRGPVRESDEAEKENPFRAAEAPAEPPNDWGAVEEIPTAGEEEEPNLTGLRLAAALIDLTRVFAVSLVFAIVSTSLLAEFKETIGAQRLPTRDGGWAALGLLLFLIPFFSLPFVLGPRAESGPAQATYGKERMGIMVVDLEGRRISLTRAQLRHAGKILTVMTLGLGFGQALGDPNQRTLHDHLSGTMVVSEDPRKRRKRPTREHPDGPGDRTNQRQGAPTDSDGAHS